MNSYEFLEFQSYIDIHSIHDMTFSLNHLHFHIYIEQIDLWHVTEHKVLRPFSMELLNLIEFWVIVNDDCCNLLECKDQSLIPSSHLNILWTPFLPMN